MVSGTARLYHQVQGSFPCQPAICFCRASRSRLVSSDKPANGERAGAWLIPRQSAPAVYHTAARPPGLAARRAAVGDGAACGPSVITCQRRKLLMISVP